MPICANCGQDNPEGFRFCGACGAELMPAPAAREVRKTVTVVFCDVTGSTAMGERLDPESTRRVMSRYYDAMREAIERHGGTVEKFIGDAVMAVFGVPVVHEDDALRAVRAAADMRGALGELNDELERDWGVRIESRIGVNTGEVVAGEGQTRSQSATRSTSPPGSSKAAAPGETLLGESTHRLVRDAVEAEPVEPLDAKGKSEPVAAFRLVGLVEGAEFIPRRLDSPLVGRENELAQLQRAYDHAVSDRVAYQFTLLGAAGIGKSRLVQRARRPCRCERCSRVGAYRTATGSRTGRSPRSSRCRRDRLRGEPRRDRAADATDPRATRARASRSSSSSTTSSGRSRRSSTSSTTSPIWRGTRRFSCSASPDRTCSTAGPAGAAAS